MEVSVWIYVLVASPQGKRPCFPFGRRLGGPWSCVCAVEKRKISYPCQESNPNSSVVFLIAWLLYWLLRNQIQSNFFKIKENFDGNLWRQVLKTLTSFNSTFKVP
jgi:hypothetical protein